MRDMQREMQRNVRQTQEQLAETQEQLIETQLPPHQTVRRGRAFVRVYIALLVVAVLAFAALAVIVSNNEVLDFDLPVERAVQSIHQPIYAWVLTQASALGWFPGSVISYVVIFAVFFVLRLRLEAVLTVGASLLADAAGVAIKGIVGRLRPVAGPVQVFAHLGGFSFPSGHVLEYTTLFGFAAYVVIVAWRNRWERNVVVGVLVLLIVLVGPSRVYLGEHYPTDVLGAYLLGGIWLAGTIELHLILKRRLGPWWVRGSPTKKVTG
jgi:undecaprenyl-diphosphatase